MDQFFIAQEKMLNVLANCIEVVFLVEGFITLVVLSIYAIGKQPKKATRLAVAAVAFFAVGLYLPALLGPVAKSMLRVGQLSVIPFILLDLTLVALLIFAVAGPSILAVGRKLPSKNKVIFWNVAAIFGWLPWGVALFLALRGDDVGSQSEHAESLEEESAARANDV